MRVLGCLVLLGCAMGCKGEPVAARTPAIEYTLGDYFFQGPDTVPAGRVTFRLKLASEAPHVLDLIRLEQGKRIGDLMAAGEDAYDSSWVKSVGGGVTSKAGTDPTYTLNLEPGLYVILCYFSAPDHAAALRQGDDQGAHGAGSGSTVHPTPTRYRCATRQLRVQGLHARSPRGRTSSGPPTRATSRTR